MRVTFVAVMVVVVVVVDGGVALGAADGGVNVGGGGGGSLTFPCRDMAERTCRINAMLEDGPDVSIGRS